MLFAPKFTSYEDAAAALDAAAWRYRDADREYREYVGIRGDEDRHATFLHRQVRDSYRALERTLEGLRRSGLSQLATDFLLSV